MPRKMTPGQEEAIAVSAPPEPRPSASVVVLSPKNEVLLLQRVKTSRSFASAHVFPGGNLDPRHDGTVPELGSPKRHRDGPSYRMAAIRECFEECGILLARSRGGSNGNSLLRLDPTTRDQKRKEIHSNREGGLTFPEFLTEIGADADAAGLIPFTRWITPIGVKRRFTTQMYLYMLPLSEEKTAGESVEQVEILPTPDGDGGVEHTTATFAPAEIWLERARKPGGDAFLMPPQAYILQLLHTVLSSTPSPSSSSSLDQVRAQRARLVEWLSHTPTCDPTCGKPGAMVPWADKVMSPLMIFVRSSDGRAVLALDQPTKELGVEEQRMGDPDRVVLVKFAKGTPREVEVRLRDEVISEEKEAKEKIDSRL